MCVFSHCSRRRRRRGRGTSQVSFSFPSFPAQVSPPFLLENNNSQSFIVYVCMELEKPDYTCLSLFLFPHIIIAREYMECSRPARPLYTEEEHTEDGGVTAIVFFFSFFFSRARNWD